jgi:hypothetical protein
LIKKAAAPPAIMLAIKQAKMNARIVVSPETGTRLDIRRQGECLRFNVDESSPQRAYMGVKVDRFGLL